MAIVNLRQARKRKAKADASKDAERNRVSHGLSKSEKSAAKSARDIQSKKLDGHKLGDTV